MDKVQAGHMYLSLVQQEEQATCPLSHW